MKTALLIPIYKPCDKALPFLSTIDPSSFEAIVVVDDGSGEEFKPIFDEIAKLPNFNVVSYPLNHGKGYALKTGIKYIKEHFEDVAGIITADGDGQHTLEDIIRVRDEMEQHPTDLVLGVRDFNSKDTPFRNKLGNKFSTLYFKLSTGKHIQDTQTGLRGIPSNLFELSLSTEGDRYEFEFNFLGLAAKETAVTQIVITTIYDNNENSHFRPLWDSMRIYKTPLLYILVATTSFFLDFGLFALIELLFIKEGSGAFVETLIPYLGARIISGPYNFIMNNFIVFPSKGDIGKKALKYLLVFLANIAVGLSILFFIDNLLIGQFGDVAIVKYLLVAFKVAVEIVIFIINYFVSKAFIFAKKKIRPKAEEKQ